MPYLNPSIDPLELGFLSILLGGSRAHCFQSFPEAVDRDWDGLGILQSRSDIEKLVINDKFRAKLCSLLLITKEEAPGDSWTDLIVEDDSGDAWEVLRFSGHAADGSKRTIKLWSLDSILQTLNDPAPRAIKVASFRNVPSFARYHPRLGWTALVHQPERVQGGLSILQDRDVYLLKDHVGDSKSSYHAVLGVTCDLFLTSLSLFKAPSYDFLDPLRVRVLVKWLGDSPNCNAVDEAIWSIYKVETFHPPFRKNLENEMRRLLDIKGSVPQKSDSSDSQDEDVPTVVGSLLTLDEHVDVQGPYSRFIFETPPSFRHSNNGVPSPAPCSTQNIGSGAFEFAPENKELSTLISPFSSNSTSYFTRIKQKGNNEWINAFVKVASAPSIEWERTMLPILSTHISPDMLQTLLAYDTATNSLVMKRLPGKTLHDYRLEYAMTGNCEGVSFKSQREAIGWFMNIELHRVHELLSLYSARVGFGRAAEVDSPIHKFFYDRLHNDVKFIKHYHPTIPGSSGESALHSDKFVTLPWLINGVEYPSLCDSFRKAEGILDPHGQTLSSLWSCLGLGDSHGGNVMISPKRQDPAIHFIDYEAAGCHSPFLDLGKPLYLDGFFSVMYHDILSKSSSDKTRSAPVSWKIADGKVSINLDAPLSDLDKVVCFMKLEYALRPLLEHTAWNSEEQMESTENVLSAALFCCALLTRDFSGCPEAFFLNCAVGVMLFNDLRGALKRFCGWDNWPVVVSSSINDKELALFSNAGDFSLTPQEFDTQLFNILFNKVDLEPDSVFLKRFEDTLRLHKQFSKNSSESSAVVVRRISDARRKGIQVAPHTCIRESIFAEPRVDHHFQYQEVQEARRTSAYPMSLVDLGCCMGTDLRKLVVDGFPVQNVMGLDIEDRFFDIGRFMYNEGDTPAIKFKQTDALDSRFSEKNANLADKFDFVHSANVVHLFQIDGQLDFIRSMAFLAKPGGLLWGRQVGLADGPDGAKFKHEEGKGTRFTASEFKQLILDATGWREEDIVYRSALVAYSELRIAKPGKNWVLQWSVRVPLDKTARARRFTELDG